MSTEFYVPRLVKEGAWIDLRNRHKGGFAMYGSRTFDKIRFAAPHHSVTNPSGDALRDVDTLANIHINGNGWLGIGYHFVITSEVVNGFAKVAYVGDIATVRAHTPNTKGAKGMAAGLGNQYIVAACMIGMNHQVMPTEPQLRSMKLLMEEMLWHEDARMPNLWNTWDDMQEHYVWDWTQCNGMAAIRNAIINAHIPADAPAPAPTPTPAPVKEASRQTYSPLKKFRFNKASKLYNILPYTVNNDKVYTNGEEIEIKQKIVLSNGNTWYRTAYSADKELGTGFRSEDLNEVLAPAPVEEKPVVRALGALKKVLVNNGDRVVNVITGEVTKTYTKDELLEATHTIEYKGKTYYMTLYSFQQYEKGKVPTGVDTTTVDAWVEIPPEVVPDPPEHEGEKPPVDEEKQAEHDKLVAELDQRVTGLEALVKKILDFLTSIFKNFTK